ncbi:MAG: RagB/SusD family nutrient uptake outer membrane protein [Williamsia sp.]|nr:RagB/SusD family nutrient uptake outer membrane protein [Williamsia sp.]
MKQVRQLTSTAAAIILAGTLLVSCKKFLSPEAVSSFDTEYVFNNIPNARKALLGAYGSMTGDYGYGIRISQYWAYDTDEMQRGTNPPTTDEGQLLAKYLSIPGNLNITNPFNQMFQGVERANLCIYNIPKMELYQSGSAAQQAQLKRMYGEALVLRAQFLYELCRNFGDVPVQWQPSQYEANLYKSRTSRDTIYDHLIADLAVAQKMMPWRTEVGSIGDPVDQRFTKGAAKALRAKIALTRGGYQLPVTGGQLVRPANYQDYYKIAHDECAEIIANPAQHTLLSSYKSLFKDYLLAHNTNDPAGEFMMVASMAFGTNADSKLGIQNGTRVNGTGGLSVAVLPSYFYMFDSTDVRRDITCVPYEIIFDTIKQGHALNAIHDGKFRREWVSNPGYVFSAGSASTSERPATNNSLQNMQLSWPLIRFADVLLWYAETENELNGAPTTDAIKAVSQINLRGHGGAYRETAPVIPATKEGFFKFLVKERMLEFGNEGVRKYDLLRWGLLGTAVTEARARMNAWATATATSHPQFAALSYMEDGPLYARDATRLPTYLYFVNRPARSSVDEVPAFLNSFYKPSDAVNAPTGQTRVNWWLGGSTQLTFTNAFAMGFTAGKTELMPIPQTQRDVNPNLTQNAGY